MVVLLVGLQPVSILIQLNLDTLNFVPWCILPASAYLYLVWWYLGGGGPPISTQENRQQLLRAGHIAPECKKLSWLAAAILGILVAAFVILGYAARSIALADLGMVQLVLSASPVTAVGIIMLVAAMSGLLEEAAFRGYMQVTLEQRYHPAIAIVVVALIFALVHPQPPVFKAIFMVGACDWGIVAYLANSIVPVIIIHALVDFTFLLWAYFNPESLESLLILDIFESGIPGFIIFWAAVWLIAATALLRVVLRLIKAKNRLAEAR